MEAWQRGWPGARQRRVPFPRHRLPGKSTVMVGRGSCCWPPMGCPTRWWRSDAGRRADGARVAGPVPGWGNRRGLKLGQLGGCVCPTAWLSTLLIPDAMIRAVPGWVGECVNLRLRGSGRAGASGVSGKTGDAGHPMRIILFPMVRLGTPRFLPVLMVRLGTQLRMSQS